MLFHAGVNRLAGGFLGVDLFFVLSGFLITTLLLTEHEATGRLWFGEFYARRARRLLPALMLVIATVVVYAQFIGPEFSRRSVRWDAIASIFYVANWRFILSDQPYFAASVEPSPLRHVWSLAIEEQWYLLWPLLLLCLLRAIGPRRMLLVPILVVSAFGSSAFMAFLVRGDADPSRAYYGLASHAFVLLGGAALAAARHAKRVAGVSERMRWGLDIAGVAGMVVIGCFFVLVDGHDRWLYQGGYVLFVAAAVLVVAAAMLPGRGVVKSVLAVGPLPWIGRISYGLYLWHWPLDVWLNAGRFDWPEEVLLAARFGAAFAVATLSFYLIERPIRHGNWQRFARPRLATLATSGVATVVLVALVLLGIRPAAVDPQVPWGGELSAGATPRPQRPTPVVPGRLRVLLVGDSVAFSQGYGADPSGATIIPGAHIGCGLVPYTRKLSDELLLWDGKPGACDGATEDWAFAATQQPDVIVLVAGAWEVYDRKIGSRTYRVGTEAYAQLIYDHLDQVRRFFEARTSAPLVIEDVPCMNPPQLGLGEKRSVRADAQRVEWVNDVFRNFAETFPGKVSMVDVSTLVCPHGEPRKKLDGVDVRPDGAHYNPEATTALWNWLTPRLLELPGVSIANVAPGGAEGGT